jgi:hypothetical protein
MPPWCAGCRFNGEKCLSEAAAINGAGGGGNRPTDSRVRTKCEGKFRASQTLQPRASEHKPLPLHEEPEREKPAAATPPAAPTYPTGQGRVMGVRNAPVRTVSRPYPVMVPQAVPVPAPRAPPRRETPSFGIPRARFSDRSINAMLGVRRGKGRR